MARPPLDYDKMLALAKGYLEECVDDLDKKVVKIPSVHGLAVKLKVSRETCYAWGNDPEKAEFSDILAEIKEKQGERLVNNGLAGTYNPTIAKLLLSSKHGYIEKTANAQIGGDGEEVSDEKAKAIAKALDQI